MYRVFKPAEKSNKGGLRIQQEMLVTYLRAMYFSIFLKY